MGNTVFDSARALGNKLAAMDEQQLCQLVSALCQQVEEQVGSKSYRGGIYPENISQDQDGSLALGSAAQGDKQGQELDFLAPEVYWRGPVSASADVYSMGLLLYYGLSGGRLPFQDECQDPQLRRMGGEDLKAPQGAGRRIGSIIEKALRFKSEDRYQSLGQMKAALDSCINNLYLKGEPSAEAIFNKKDDDLSDLERMMVDIIEGGDLPAEKEEQLDEEQVKVYAPSTPKAKAKAKARADHSEDPAQVIARQFKSQSNPAVPKMREKKDPELAPIVPKRPVKTPPVQYTRNMEREKEIAKSAKKRRRPLAVILVLCALLVVVAIVFNAMLKDLERIRSQAQPSPTADPFASTPAPTTDPKDPYGFFKDDDEQQGGGAAEASPSPSAEPETSPSPVPHSYQLLVEDVSWAQAQQRCTELGGHLVVINDKEEFDRIVAMAEEKGVPRIWIGCHRVDGKMVWENGQTGYLDGAWAKGEPSYVDINDQVAEDYVMLWNNNGWGYNDNRNDPIADYPAWYSGTVGFICEFGD